MWMEHITDHIVAGNYNMTLWKYLTDLSSFNDTLNKTKESPWYFNDTLGYEHEFQLFY